MAPARPSLRRKRYAILAIGMLALAIGLLHGRSVSYGLFLDDYAHYTQLRAAGWSLGELTSACYLELVGGVVDMWWLPETTLRFFRPVSFALLKCVYTISHWWPAAAHLASLFWHLVVCVLLLLLLRRIGVGRGLALAASLLFAIHPAHVATVQWIASQTELVVTMALLTAMHAFLSLRGYPALPPEPGGYDPAAVAPPRGFKLGFTWALFIVAFVAALGSRENAVMLPFVLIVVEFMTARRRLTATGLRPYFVMAGLIVAYLVVRSTYLGGAALPPRPYIVPPTAPDFVRYVFDKAAYYLLGEFLLAPCVPIGGLAFLRDHAAVFYGAAGIVAALLAIQLVRNRHLPAPWLGLAWLFGFMAPVLPAFESPHHLYLPGVGWAVLFALVLQGLHGPGVAERPFRARLTGIVVLLSFAVFIPTTYIFGRTFDVGQQVEDRFLDEVRTAPRPLKHGDTLYVGNFPMLAHYAQLALEEQTGLSDLRVVPLTWSPRMLGITARTELTHVDDHTLEVRVAGERYFAGPYARLIEEATGRTMPIEPGQPIDHGDFVVELVDYDDEGVIALRYTFARPLSDPDIHVFWGSQTRWACQIRW